MIGLNKFGLHLQHVHQSYSFSLYICAWEICGRGMLHFLPN